MEALEAVSDRELSKKSVNCVVAVDFPKSGVLGDIASKLSFQVRKHHINYRQLCHIFERVRKENSLHRPKRERRPPQLLTEDDLTAFFKGIENTEHEIMMRFLLFSAIRVNELVNVKVSDVDLGNCKVFIDQGKGSKDRYVLFPESMRLVLRTHIQAHSDREYLFQSRQYRQYSPRRIQQLMQKYGQKAGLGNRVHPHLFRHQQLTALTRSGLTDAQIQVISGHGSKKSLEVYQHIGLESVEKAYQQAMKGMAI
jgi:integrase/recombinase XerD